MPTPAIPTISKIDQIATLEDPVIRNLQITQCYHELSLVLAARTGGSANWCSFATWASKQAGQTIRKEDLARALEQVLGAEASTVQTARDLAAAAQRVGVRLGIEAIMEVAWKALDPRAAFELSSEAVARGNLKVFAEIGREFARFYAVCLPDRVYDDGNISGFCQALRPGDPPEGQRYLRQAFQRYYQAMFEQDEKARVELLLLANLEIGFHEQTRLQPEINAALAASVISPEAFVRNLLRALRPDWDWLDDLVWLILRLVGRITDFDRAIAAYLAAAQRQAQHITTETLMVIDLPPHNRLRLGDDLTAIVPPTLRQLANPDLLALLARIDPTPDSLQASGADYWGDLDDRLHFIADMFRCYQLAGELFSPPFTPDQVLDLEAGRLPGGRL